MRYSYWENLVDVSSEICVSCWGMIVAFRFVGELTALTELPLDGQTSEEIRYSFPPL